MLAYRKETYLVKKGLVLDLDAWHQKILWEQYFLPRIKMTCTNIVILMWENCGIGMFNNFL
jgi:hypothetical protein